MESLIIEVMKSWGGPFAAAGVVWLLLRTEFKAMREDVTDLKSTVRDNKDTFERSHDTCRSERIAQEANLYDRLSETARQVERLAGRMNGSH